MIRVLSLLALLLCGCLEPIDIEEETFPCRAPEDCIEGFLCSPTRWVCVREGEVPDAGVGALDAS